MKHVLLGSACAFLLAIAACSGPADEADTNGDASAPSDGVSSAPEPEGDDAAADGVDSVQLIKLDCGTIYVSDLDIFSTAGDYAGETDTFTNTCWLVRHPDGNLLWDLGLPGILTSQEEQATGVFTVSLDETISEQVKDLGLSMSDIDYVAVSHSHFDHTGQVDLLEDPVWLVNQMEYDYMFPEPEVSEEAPAAGESDADGADAANQFPGFDLLTYEIIPDNHDVFGDGSVIIFMTPGHTPGHASLLVNLPETGPVLLTGDLYHRTESRELKRVPQFNSSEDATLASMETFEDRADTLGAQVIIQHEPADTDDLPDVMR
ncbi:MAG: N-acyl homoserine lactonase family protein [Henriciella sp.]|uniref:N-acyl homoserine lactonase family protein n=1 Tax=Henriciella sp. TaxID=1968823 RepID=UPI003C7541BD